MRKPRDLYPVTKEKKKHTVRSMPVTALLAIARFRLFWKCFLIHTMNKVDYLLRMQFSTLPLEEKLEIKRLGPHRPDDLILLQPGQNATRTFKTEWYDRKTWLTASTSKRALFCFPCLLFGIGTNADSVRTRDGFKDLKHLAERTVKHESCKPHNQLHPAIGTIGARQHHGIAR